MPRRLKGRQPALLSCLPAQCCTLVLCIDWLKGSPSSVQACFTGQVDIRALLSAPLLQELTAVEQLLCQQLAAAVPPQQQLPAIPALMPEAELELQPLKEHARAHEEQGPDEPKADSEPDKEFTCPICIVGRFSWLPLLRLHCQPTRQRVLWVLEVATKQTRVLGNVLAATDESLLGLQDILYQPVALKCGHVYCARCAVNTAVGHDRYAQTQGQGCAPASSLTHLYLHTKLCTLNWRSATVYAQPSGDLQLCILQW